MAFSTNYEEENLLPEGDYECIILAAFVNSTPGGALYFSVRLAVRNDVPQKYRNRNIFHAIWQRRPEKQTEDDKKIDGFSYKQLMNLSQAAGIPKGKSYETLDDLGHDLKGRCVRVTVGHDEWNGQTNVRVKWSNKTKFPDCKHITGNNNPPQNNPDVTTGKDMDLIDMPADDLPF